MSTKHVTKEPTDSLKELLDTTDKGLKDLFIKVMNLHAAHQITTRTQAQLTAEVRKHIEESLNS